MTSRIFRTTSSTCSSKRATGSVYSPARPAAGTAGGGSESTGVERGEDARAQGVATTVLKQSRGCGGTADAHGPGPCGGNPVEVRILSPALIEPPERRRSPARIAPARRYRLGD